MAKNYDIKTESVHLAAAAVTSTVAVGSDVAAGMTRYVTFVRFGLGNSAMAAKGSKVFLCSGTGTASADTDNRASATQKLVLVLASVSAGGAADLSTQVPESPNTEHPLFTIAAGKALIAHRSTVAGLSASAYLFVQYFDE